MGRQWSSLHQFVSFCLKYIQEVLAWGEMKSSPPPAGDQEQQPGSTTSPCLAPDKTNMLVSAEMMGLINVPAVQMTQCDRPNRG